ncbi:674_t:CDS:2 [Dentiscutata erythropus]|uniref:674_t:CDS:1 n=1 Tax=Dentiscutata erythropus TaxID=1348616 RepID=A0A9N8Z496_9GLOM|nr:674_t:CDS:2 [Dentiscutata erythropus]
MNIDLIVTTVAKAITSVFDKGKRRKELLALSSDSSSSSSKNKKENRGRLVRRRDSKKSKVGSRNYSNNVNQLVEVKVKVLAGLAAVVAAQNKIRVLVEGGTLADLKLDPSKI